MMGYPLHLFTVELYYFEFGFVKGHMANGGGRRFREIFSDSGVAVD
jgi:hypothetical protein